MKEESFCVIINLGISREAHYFSNLPSDAIHESLYDMYFTVLSIVLTKDIKEFSYDNA